jgi:hypothetical protein
MIEAICIFSYKSEGIITTSSVSLDYDNKAYADTFHALEPTLAYAKIYNSYKTLKSAKIVFWQTSYSAHYKHMSHLPPAIGQLWHRVANFTAYKTEREVMGLSPNVYL